ncbi:MAG: hypothetical protein QNK05_03310 [Myxococcota bacterium]|nr:hypothetical protein [Myxococcota bacterium]
MLALPPEAVGPRLAQELDRVASREEIAAQSRLAAAVGLVPAGLDLRAEMLRMQSGSVAGFFTPLDRTLFVVAGADGMLPDDAGFQSVVVHELAHALQAVHSSLPDVTLGLRDHDDLAFALASVLEGDATWSMLRDESLQDGLAQRGAEEVALGFEELIAESEALGTPRWLRESFLRPYALGYAQALEHVERDGPAGLDAWLAEPPLSSRELMHGGEPLELVWLPVDARGVAPDVRCRPTAANTYGEVGLQVALREAGLLDDEPGAQGEDGLLRGDLVAWRADRAMLLDCPDGSALAWLVQLDVEQAEEASRERLFDALADLATHLELRFDREGARALLSRGLEPGGRGRLLALPEQRHADLASYLESRPEILEHVRWLRRPRIELRWPPALAR